MQPINGLEDSRGEIRDIVFVGGGVTGTAGAMVMANYITGVKSITLLEKNSRVAMVNSGPRSNANTSHDGGTETNYSLAHALKIQWQAWLLRHYCLLKNDPNLFWIANRMVLAVGDVEIARLRKRYDEFLPHYPDLRLVEAEELAELEPKVMLGRNPKEKVLAMVSDQGFAINYQVLSEHMLADAQKSGVDFVTQFNTTVEFDSVRRDEDGIFVLTTVEKTEHGNVTSEIRAKVVVFAAGAYSLLFAQALGEGQDFIIFSVEGIFISVGDKLRNKVYCMQEEDFSFAEMHGDPSVFNRHNSRIGPTTKPIPFLERGNYNSVLDYFRTGILTWSGMVTIFIIVFNNKMMWYVIKNYAYGFGKIGMYLFLRAARKIIPSLKFSDLVDEGDGGVRPQIANKKTHKLIMGDSCIVGDNFIANTTPSPGASICIGNAVRDAEQVAKFLGTGYKFERQRLLQDLGVEDREIQHEVMVKAA